MKKLIINFLLTLIFASNLLAAPIETNIGDYRTTLDISIKDSKAFPAME